jgi:hypothetical protein
LPETDPSEKNNSKTGGDITGKHFSLGSLICCLKRINIMILPTDWGLELCFKKL